MSINFPDKNPSILVPDPPGDGHVVNAGHHTHADEVMPTVVKPKLGQTGFLPGQKQGFPKSSGLMWDASVTKVSGRFPSLSCR